MSIDAAQFQFGNACGKSTKKVKRLTTDARLSKLWLIGLGVLTPKDGQQNQPFWYVTKLFTAIRVKLDLHNSMRKTKVTEFPV